MTNDSKLLNFFGQSVPSSGHKNKFHGIEAKNKKQKQTQLKRYN